MGPVRYGAVPGHQGVDEKGGGAGGGAVLGCRKFWFSIVCPLPPLLFDRTAGIGRAKKEGHSGEFFFVIERRGTGDNRDTRCLRYVHPDTSHHLQDKHFGSGKTAQIIQRLSPIAVAAQPDVVRQLQRRNELVYDLTKDDGDVVAPPSSVQPTTPLLATLLRPQPTQPDRCEVDLAAGSP
jgi:hypothetical protein